MSFWWTNFSLSSPLLYWKTHSWTPTPSSLVRAEQRRGSPPPPAGSAYPGTLLAFIATRMYSQLTSNLFSKRSLVGRQSKVVFHLDWKETIIQAKIHQFVNGDVAGASVKSLAVVKVISTALSSSIISLISSWKADRLVRHHFPFINRWRMDWEHLGGVGWWEAQQDPATHTCNP